jgi:hypothetical protein
MTHPIVVSPLIVLLTVRCASFGLLPDHGELDAAVGRSYSTSLNVVLKKTHYLARCSFGNSVYELNTSGKPFILNLRV